MKDPAGSEKRKAPTKAEMLEKMRVALDDISSFTQVLRAIKMARLQAREKEEIKNVEVIDPSGKEIVFTPDKFDEVIKRSIAVIGQRIPTLEKAIAQPELYLDAISLYVGLLFVTDNESFSNSIARSVARVAPHLSTHIQEHKEYTEDSFHLLTGALSQLTKGFSFKKEKAETFPQTLETKALSKATIDSVPALFNLLRSPDLIPPEEIRTRLSLATLASHAFVKIPVQDIEMKERIEAFFFQVGDFIASAVASKYFDPTYSDATFWQEYDAKKKGTKPPERQTKPNTTFNRMTIEQCVGNMATNRHFNLVMNGMLEHFGINVKECLDLLVNSHQELKSRIPKHTDKMIFNQLETMHALERKYPGSVKELHQRYGLLWLSRYPLPVLLDMYEHRDDTSKPYILVVSARTDATGAMFMEEDRKVIQDLYDGAKANGYHLRCVEAGTTHALATQFETLNDIYGEKHLISHMVLRGHSQSHGMALGFHDNEYGDLDSVTVREEEFAESKRFFTESPLILIDGCGTSLSEKSIARAISDVFDARVLAPKGRTSSIDAVTFEMKGTKLTITPTYSFEDSGKSVPPTVFIRGKKV